jgi:G:T-mismatch repair DNA endonuclease (very short patch repair protein)
MYKKGYHHTEEEKDKIRLSKLGANNPNYGKKLSVETREKMSKSRSGERHWFYGKHVSDEQKARQKEALQEYYSSPDGVALKQKLSKLTAQTKPRLGSHTPFSPEAKVRMKAVRKKQWQNPVNRDKIVRASRLGSNVRPTKPETILMDLLNAVASNEWKYTGDGDVVICGRNPDFTNVNGKKSVILLHGIYWHLWRKQKKNPELTKEIVEDDDKKFYKTYGWDCLIVWDDELKDPDAVKAKIAEFVEGS